MLKPEIPPYSTSLRITPIREAARPAKLLIGKPKSKQQKEETFSEKTFGKRRKKHY